MVLPEITVLASGFEGCEKKLEIDFRAKQTRVETKYIQADSLLQAPVDSAEPDLRHITRKTWDHILDQAKCTIISVTKNDHFTAYVLSESSLFVYPHRVMIKTCGTTTLLHCMPHLLEAAEAQGMEPEFVSFSRSNFMFPNAQPYPHRSFAMEVRLLQAFFPTGNAHILGPMNGPRWHYFVADLRQERPHAPTLELVMFDLDPKVMRLFFQDPDDDPATFASKPKRTGLTATVESGIDKLMPGATIDDFLFEPCGYSCNALLDSVYFTIHITPEPQCCFVSFETNAPVAQHGALVQRVLKTFKPGRFIMSLLVDTNTVPAGAQAAMEWDIEDFTAKGKTFHMFEHHYSIGCGQYKSPPSPLQCVSSSPSITSVSGSADATPRGASHTHSSVEYGVMHSGLSEAEHGPRSAPHSPVSSDDEEKYRLDKEHEKEKVDIHEEARALALQVMEDDYEHVKYGMPYHLSHLMDQQQLHQLIQRAVTEDTMIRIPHSLKSSAAAERLWSLLNIESGAEEKEMKGALSADGQEDAASSKSLLEDHQTVFAVDLDGLVDWFSSWSNSLPEVEPVLYLEELCSSDGLLSGMVRSMACVGSLFTACSWVHAAKLLQLGVSPSRIVLEVPYPSDAILRAAKSASIGFLVVGSEEEIKKAHAEYPSAFLLLRVAPPATEVSEPYDDEGGAALENVPALLQQAKRLDAHVVGCAVYFAPVCAASRLREARVVSQMAKDAGIDFSVLYLCGDLVSPDAVKEHNITALSHLNELREMLASPKIRVFAAPDHRPVYNACTFATRVLCARSYGKAKRDAPVKSYHVSATASMRKAAGPDDSLDTPLWVTKDEFGPKERVKDRESDDRESHDQALALAAVRGSSFRRTDVLAGAVQLPSLNPGDWLCFPYPGAMGLTDADAHPVLYSSVHVMAPLTPAAFPA